MRPVRVSSPAEVGPAWQELRRAHGLPASRKPSVMKLGDEGPVLFRLHGRVYTLYVGGIRASLR